MTRTCDLQVRNLTLYPTELWARKAGRILTRLGPRRPPHPRRGGAPAADGDRRARVTGRAVRCEPVPSSLPGEDGEGAIGHAFAASIAEEAGGASGSEPRLARRHDTAHHGTAVARSRLERWAGGPQDAPAVARGRRRLLRQPAGSQRSRLDRWRDGGRPRGGLLRAAERPKPVGPGCLGRPHLRERRRLPADHELDELHHRTRHADPDAPPRPAL